MVNGKEMRGAATRAHLHFVLLQLNQKAQVRLHERSAARASQPAATAGAAAHLLSHTCASACASATMPSVWPKLLAPTKPGRKGAPAASRAIDCW